MLKRYELNASVITANFGKTVEPWASEHDDRRVAYNMYQQVLKACADMAKAEDAGMDSPFIRCAVNEAIQAQCSQIKSIVDRFTHKEITC